jgi:hypothetical protein
MDIPQSLLQREFSSSYRHTVEQFASNAGLDCEALLEGKGFDYKGLRFRLENYGAMDPDGFFVLVEAAQFSSDNEGLVCRRLLEMNLLMPAGLLGYYAVMPGTNCAMFCVRIDLAKTRQAHVVAAALMETLRAELERTMTELTQAVEDAAGTTIPRENTFA